MIFLRWISRALLLVLIAIGAVSWVTVATLQATILNRHEVKRWLSDSGGYTHIVSNLVHLDQAVSAGKVLDESTLQQALQQTLTPDFVQQSAETAIDSTYDWLEGKAEDITFSIPLSQERTAFIANLQAALLPKLSSLPKCSSSLTISAGDVTCIPQGKTATQLAQQMAEQSVGGSSDFLTAPITPADVSKALDIPTDNPFGWLQGITKLVPTLVVALPILTLLCAAGYVLLSTEKLKNISIVAKYILCNIVLLTITGIALWYFGGQLNFGDTPIVSDVVVPIAKQTSASIGMWLTLYSGIVCVICIAVWIAIAVIEHRKKQTGLALPPRQPEQHLPPTKPAAPQA